MIYTNGIELIKAKCAYIDTEEVDRINDYIGTQRHYYMAYELPDTTLPDPNPWSSVDVDMQHLDPLFEDVARFIVREQLGSTSFVQRKFAIGYNRAGRILDQLEKAGIVGPAMGSAPREVLVHDTFSLDFILRSLK